MLPRNISASLASRLPNLAVILAISATASVASPFQSASLSALTLTLGCLCFTLFAAVVALLLARRAKPAATPEVTPQVPPDAEIVKNARDAIFVIQESGEILSSNPSAEKLFGYPFSELRGKSISALIPPPSKGRRENYIHAAEGKEVVGVRKSGGSFPLDLVLSEIPGNNGKRFSVIARDRSERNRVEEEIVGQRRFASSLIDNLPSLFVVVDRDGRLVRFNRTCEELTRFSEGEVRGQYLWQAVSAPAGMENAKQHLLAILAGDFPARSQSSWYLRDNSLRTIAWTHNALRDEYGRLTHLISTGVDVTNSLLLEDRRREADSLNTAGRLASGIAHDFNNLLTAITGYSGLALVNLDKRNPVRNDIEEIKCASDRGASLTRQLLTFSGNHPRNAKPISFNETVHNIERLVRIMAGEGIHVDLSLEPDLPLVFADTQFIEECIMHLVANAKEAMPNGGTLQIQTGIRSLNRTRLDARPPIGPGEYVTISVVDTGSGIPPQALPHIFEPFYTTKKSPISNGMGLAMVYGIVRQAEGSIVVHSAPTYGSTFRIFLPLASHQVPRPQPEPVNEESLLGDETVLLAMESDLERQRLRDAMDSAGYKVIDARSGLQALEIAHKSTEIIQLLITDIALPRMSGLALAESVRDRIPAIRTLFATSRSAEDIRRHGIQPDTVLRLSRTSNSRFVLLRVREALTDKLRQ